MQQMSSRRSWGGAVDGCVGVAAKGGWGGKDGRDEMIGRLGFPARGPGGTSGVFSPDLRQRRRGNTAGLITAPPAHTSPPDP